MLMETLMAVVILAIGLSATAITFTLAMRYSSASNHYVNAMHTARNELERVRTIPFNNTGLDTGTHSISTNGLTGTYVVTDVSTGVKDVVMNVNWNNHGNGGMSTLSLTTSLTKPMH